MGDGERGECMEIEFLVRDGGRTSGKLMKRVAVRMSLSDFTRSLTNRGGMFGDYREWP